MVSYRRNFVPGGTYFFTVTLANKSATMLIAHVDKLRVAFRDCRKAHQFEILAIVVLPEHLHCVWTLPANDADYPTCWRLIKSAFTRMVGSRAPARSNGEVCFGKGDSGSIPAGISRICNATSITCISIR